MSTKELAILAANALDSKNGEDIIILDIAEKSSFADYLILASATNERLLGALVDETEYRLEKESLFVKSVEGEKKSGWLLMDYGDVVVNVLTNEMRTKYNIEKIWADCTEVNWEV